MILFEFFSFEKLRKNTTNSIIMNSPQLFLLLKNYKK